MRQFAVDGSRIDCSFMVLFFATRTNRAFLENFERARAEWNFQIRKCPKFFVWCKIFNEARKSFFSSCILILLNCQNDGDVTLVTDNTRVCSIDRMQSSFFRCLSVEGISLSTAARVHKQTYLKWIFGWNDFRFHIIRHLNRLHTETWICQEKKSAI